MTTHSTVGAMSETQSVQLTIMSGPDDGALIRLESPRQGEAFVFGRRDDCDVVLAYDSQVSRQHASLSSAEGQWYLQDLNSKNGTYIGKDKVGQAPVLLEPGQMFRVGRTWLRLEIVDDEDTQTAIDNLD